MDTISGGTIPTGGSVKMTIDSGKIGYIILPNKSVLTTNGSGVINTTYAGIAGKLTYYIPKNNGVITINGSSLVGAVVYDGDSQITFNGVVGLTSVVALNTTYVDAIGSSLTAKACGDILYNAYSNNFVNCLFDFSGGLNAFDTEIDSYLTDTYGVSLATITTLLVTTNGGELYFNS